MDFQYRLHDGVSLTLAVSVSDELFVGYIGLRQNWYGVKVDSVLFTSYQFDELSQVTALNVELTITYYVNDSGPMRTAKYYDVPLEILAPVL